MKNKSNLYNRIREILGKARFHVARSVNTTQVVANWLIGEAIVQDEQKGRTRSGYGEKTITQLARRLEKEYGIGYGATNLKLFRQFYRSYPKLCPPGISHAVSDLSLPVEIGHATSDLSWRPGRLSSALSWTHYRQLLKIDNPNARSFYEIESVKNTWSARELERQVNSLLYERLALSRDKKGLIKLSRKGQVISKPADVFKDPVVIEFLGLPESHRLVESKIEEALISNLREFLLEMGKGFAFVARQERLTLDGDHFYVDLVFYHTILKCYVLIDLKTGKLTHSDLGQLQLYVNYFDQKRKADDDNPTLGLILCTDKNDAVVKYMLGAHQERKIFTSRYKLHVPTEKELKSEIRRELKEMRLEHPRQLLQNMQQFKPK